MPPTIIVEVWPFVGLGAGSDEAVCETGRSEIKDGVRRLTDVTRPQLHLYPAAGIGPHPAVMVCPGGGYQVLAADLEGSEIACWLNGLGWTAAVLHYRVPCKPTGAYVDGLRSLDLLRWRADEFDIDPNCLGILGFSAGAHLCAQLARDYSDDSRPDFAALIYPAYLLDEDGRPAPGVEPVAPMPPLFLTQALDDSHLCAPAYATALQDAGVSTTTAFYAHGDHGYGLRLPPDQPAYAWAAEAASWLKKQR